MERERLARALKALGDETRLRLVAELACRGEVTCGEFAAMCRCSGSVLTYHQRVLSEAGLIRVRRQGQFRWLALRTETFDELLPGFLARLAGQADALKEPARVEQDARASPATDPLEGQLAVGLAAGTTV